MARIEVLAHAFNIGVVDSDKLHRVDLERMRLAAERQTNFLCDSIGKAYGRPGFGHIDDLPGATRPIAFVAGSTDAAMLLLSDLAMRVYDQASNTIVTRASVSTTITNGDFSSATGWTLAATSGQTSAISGGKLTMSARAHGAKASCKRTASVAAGADQAAEHGLRIIVDRGPVIFKLGTTDGGDDLIGTTSLKTGEHSLAFTPGAATIYLEFQTEAQADRIVDSVQIEAAGVMSLPTIWPAAALPLIREAQSLDVLYVACDGYKEQRIERRSDTSWSVVDYDRIDGPFQAGRSAEVTLTPSVLEGNGTLTASSAFFTADHVGALFRIFHEGQKIDTYLAGANTATPAFLVTGITETNFEERKFTTQLSGTWVGTVRHRRSSGGEFGDYVDYRREQASAVIDMTANATYTNDDNDDNIDMWVRADIPDALYTSGEVRVRFTYQGGGGFGICRVTGYVSSTVVSIEVLTPFKGTGAVKDWRQSRWDGWNGYPSAVAFTDGRITWSGSDLFDASISDAFDSFDENFVGDAGPLSRSIGLGGRNLVRWALPLSSLMLGCDSRVANVRASSLDEILTPDNFGMKSSGKIGAAAISPIELADDRAVFVQASGSQLYEILWSAEKSRYITSPFSKLTTGLFLAGIKSLAVQTLPDQRVWVTNTSDDAVCIVFEPTQGVLAAHVTISTSFDTDFFEYFAVLPGTDQDRLYAVIRRNISGVDVYHFEAMALDTEVAVATVCKVMDGHVTGTGAHSATITGLDHLEGRDVVAWVDGAPVLDATITTPGADDAKVFTVTSGQITLPVAPASGYCVGQAYDYQYKSSRLAYGVQGYTPMLKNKSLAALGLLLSDYCRSGVKYGTERGAGFSTPWSLPDISSATGTTATEVVAGIDEDEHPFPGGSEIDLDVRVCVAGRSPKPLAMRSLVLAIETTR